MNIVNIIGAPVVGGVQNGIVALSKYDKSLRIDRNIICIYPRYTEKSGVFDQNSEIRIHYCTTFFKKPILRPYVFWKKIRYFFGLITFPFRFYFLLKRVKPDVVINEEPKLIIIQALICKIISVPFILHMHKELSLQKNFIFSKLIIKNTFFISDSKNVIDKNLGFYESQYINSNTEIPIIPATSILLNSDFTIKKDSKKKIIRIGTIGRLVWEKNFKQLIEIAKELKSKINLDFKISIVGDGPEYNIIKELIKKNNLEEIIVLKGEFDNTNIINFLSKLDIYIQTSVSEVSPLTIKEAMAASLPVISSDVGGINDIIRNNINGFLIQKNDTDQFVETIINIINLKDRKKYQIGKNARKSILKNFSPENTAIKYFQCINQILSGA